MDFNDDDVLLVCAPADFPLMAANFTFDQKCCLCQGRVMMAPSGREFLARNLNAKVVCIWCVPDGEHLFGIAMKEHLAAEMKSVQPNLRRNRN